jgi:F0F1-type ATP synthase assembly protein I
MPFNRPIPHPKPQDKAPSALASLVEAEKMMQIAVLLPSAAFIGWLIGAWLDHHLHQSWIALAGILFGGVSGLVYVIRLVLTTGARTGKQSDSALDAGNGKGSPGPKP